MQEIGGIATIEGTVEIGREGIGANALGTAAILVRMTTDEGIELLTIGSGDILHIGEILQTALNLKGRGACLYQFLQMSDAVHVFQR